MMYDNLALIIKPLHIWNINVPTISYVTESEFYFATKGQVGPENVLNDETLGKLIMLCAKCEVRALYDAYGRKNFRNYDDFWAKADKHIQSYVKQIVDKKLAEVIKEAVQLGIHLFLRSTGKEELLKKNELVLSSSIITPLMSFKKGKEGIDYRLYLKLNKDKIITPCEHQPLLLTENPGLLLLANQMFFLSENFNGKLLLPFFNKPSTFIPQRMQNEYFRRFILKNAYKIEIEAEGFDIIEVSCSHQCRLFLERNIFGEPSLTVKFIYGDVVFDQEDKRQLYIRLEENEESFCFKKIIRDKNWENIMLIMLKKEWSLLPKDASLSQLIMWLNEHRDDFRKAGIDFCQPSTRKYYIGNAMINQSTNWKNDWFQMHIEIQLDNGVIIPFLKLRDVILRGEHEYMLDDGTVFLIPDEWLTQYAGLLMFGLVEKESLSLHRCQMPIMGTLNKYETENILSSEILLPERLNAQLRCYQQAGYKWLYRHFLSRTGCCLSDDMGLGKTIQAIALILKYKETCRKRKIASEKSPQVSLFSDQEMKGETVVGEPSGGDIPYATVLVISPASVVYNWRNELHRFAPQLTVCEYIGSTDERRKKRQTLMNWDVILTTYQTLRNDIEYFSRFFFGILVFDESQNFKNRNSQIYHAVTRLQSYHRLALSGTPLENSLSDLWSLMNVLNPLLLGSHQSFQRNYINPIFQNLEDVKSDILRTLVSPYFLKRTKEEVLSDLPERQDELVVCEMTSEQQQAYNEELSCARNLLLSDHSSTSVPVLTAITRMRQIANHPLLAGKRFTTSGKFIEIFSRLEMLYETTHKVLLFSESVSLLQLIGKEIEKRNWTYEMLTGETNNREAVINRFAENAMCHFFLISLKAGGVGLNLTSADYVFLLDPWWNRAAEEQAIGRSHRIGQQRAVFVYRFISRNTLEEQILDLQERKQSLIEAVLPFIKENSSVL